MSWDKNVLAGTIVGSEEAKQSLSIYSISKMTWKAWGASGRLQEKSIDN
jgi:hypothetical protein